MTFSKVYEIFLNDLPLGSSEIIAMMLTKHIFDSRVLLLFTSYFEERAAATAKKVRHNRGQYPVFERIHHLDIKIDVWREF